MSKIYTSIEAFEEAQEKEFRQKVEEIAYYQGDVERTTLDGEWTEAELQDDVYTEARKLLEGTDGKKGLAEQYKYRALKDKDLLLPEYMKTHICDNYDVVEVYNRLVDMHRNDEKVLFGIHYFDDIVRKEIIKVLKNNLVSQ